MQIHELSSVGQKHVGFIELDDKEKILYEIRKHPVGAIGLYIFGLFVSATIMAASLALVIMADGDKAGLGTDLSVFKPLIILLGGVLSIFTLVMTAIGAYLYRSNVVYITNEKVAQVLYRTIFDRKISQLSIGDVQDVTTSQNGLFARFFNYGTLVIETAGEQSNYTFTFTPNPYEASKAIVNAHEENLKLYGN